MSRSGGVRPIFRTERSEDSITFLVMSGNQVATRMTAAVEPLDGGRRTRVTARVERGDAPDDFVSPAFRSEGVTLGLFSLAIEGELDELVAPPRRSHAECVAIEERMLAANAPAGAGDRPDNLKQAIGGAARTMVMLSAVQAELRRMGCPAGGPGGGNGFTPVSEQMGPGDGGGPPRHGATFEAGRPMVDVRRGRDRDRH